MGNSIKRINKKGFTLVEMIFVIAIMAIVMGIAVSGISSLFRDMEDSRLNNAARELYTVAQNRMAAISANGELNRLSSYASSASGSIMYFGNNMSDAVEIVFPSGFMNGTNGNYIIEYDTSTAIVHGVYYWEEGTFNYGASSQTCKYGHYGE